MNVAPRAVFLDRDGTLNTEKEYLCDPAQLELYPETGRALRQLQDADFLLFVVTNQSGIGRGYYSEADMHAVNRRLKELLSVAGVEVRKIYFAPEAPEQPSRGRKPSPQFLFDARDEFGVELGRSFMIGDKLIDRECGWNAGARRSILVRTGYGQAVESAHPEISGRAWVVDDLPAAAKMILSNEHPPSLP